AARALVRVSSPKGPCLVARSPDSRKRTTHGPPHHSDRAQWLALALAPHLASPIRTTVLERPAPDARAPGCRRGQWLSPPRPSPLARSEREVRIQSRLAHCRRW